MQTLWVEENKLEKFYLTFFVKRQVLDEATQNNLTAIIVDTVSMTSTEKSVSLNTEAEVASACMLSMSSVSIHNLLQARDPLHGKEVSLEYFKDGPFKPSLNKYSEIKESSEVHGSQ